jgi:CBS domain-containing protein
VTTIPKVDDYMARTLYTFLPSDNIHSAVKTLLEKRISGAPVLDESGNLVGLLSKKDCLKVVYSASYHQDWGGRVDEFMRKEIETIESGIDIIEVADRFVGSSFRRFPVMKQGKLVGQISRHDILLALYDQWPDLES